MCILCIYPFAQVAGEEEVAGEGVGECGVELQDLQQSFSLDDMEVAVCQRSDVSTGVSQSGFFPEDVAEHVAFTWRGGRKYKKVRFQWMFYFSPDLFSYCAHFMLLHSNISPNNSFPAYFFSS